MDAAGNRRGQATRDRILAAAMTCFERKGLDLTLDDVAAEAETTRMTVHRHTGGREALITYLALRASAEVGARALTALDQDRPFGDRLRDAVIGVVEDMRAAPHLLDLLAPTATAEGWPRIDPDERVLGTVWDLFRPSFAAAAADGVLRHSAEDSIGWLLTQLLLYLSTPDVVMTNADIEHQVDRFVIPALLA